MLGTCRFLKGKNCKTIGNNDDKHEVLHRYIELRSQSCMGAGKLRDVNMHLLALGHWWGSPKQLVALNEPHRVVLWVGDGFYSTWSENTCLAINQVLSWVVAMYVGKAVCELWHFHSPAEHVDSNNNHLNIQLYKLWGKKQCKFRAH